MAVKLRLALFGKKHAPIFRIVAIDSRKMRDGKYLENLGTYNPMTGEYVQFHPERIDAWIAEGAIPSDSVKKLYKRFKKGVQPKTKTPQSKPAKPKVVKSEKVETKVEKLAVKKVKTPKQPIEKKEEKEAK